MNKKILALGMLGLGLVGLTACGKQTNINLDNLVIEQRENLFVAQDSLYQVSYSGGMREQDYAFDGVKTEMVPFGIVTFNRLNFEPLAEDSYNYVVNIDGVEYTGTLENDQIENSYSIDLGVNALNTSTINVKIDFTGYSFNQELSNVSSEFAVDQASALKIANNELSSQLKNIVTDSNKVEVVQKIVRDYATPEVSNYYWYVGAVSTNGETLGVLIDANSGEILAKKV